MSSQQITIVCDTCHVRAGLAPYVTLVRSGDTTRLFLMRIFLTCVAWVFLLVVWIRFYRVFRDPIYE